MRGRLIVRIGDSIEHEQHGLGSLAQDALAADHARRALVCCSGVLCLHGAWWCMLMLRSRRRRALCYAERAVQITTMIRMGDFSNV